MKKEGYESNFSRKKKAFGPAGREPPKKRFGAADSFLNFEGIQKTGARWASEGRGREGGNFKKKKIPVQSRALMLEFLGQNSPPSLGKLLERNKNQGGG